MVASGFLIIQIVGTTRETCMDDINLRSKNVCKFKQSLDDSLVQLGGTECLEFFFNLSGEGKSTAVQRQQ
jgi:hypothetical protein